MALTKVSGGVLQQPINVGVVTATSAEVADINVSGVSTFSNTFTTGIGSFSNTSDSTTIDTGSVVIEGGVGIEKRLNVGGLISAEESAIVMNPNSISRSTTIPANYNAQTIGPDISVGIGVTVIISSGSNWTIT